MLKTGEYHDMEASRFTPQGVYLKSGDEEVLLPRKLAPDRLKEGDKINVFVYTDSEDRLVATTQRPRATAGEFAFLKVVDMNRYGAFVDWGLDKDLLVPFSEQRQKMEKDKKYVIRITHDPRTNRLIGVQKFRDFLRGDASALEHGREVNLLIFDATEIGYKAIVDNTYEGLVYRNEVFEPLKTGDSKKGYIKKVRDDGKVDVSLYREGMDAVKDAEAAVLDKLRAANGFLPYHDKSDPEVISREFRMSKKTFKKALGGLYKARKITISEKGVRLN